MFYLLFSLFLFDLCSFFIVFLPVHIAAGALSFVTTIQLIKLTFIHTVLFSLNWHLGFRLPMEICKVIMLQTMNLFIVSKREF